VLILNDSLLLVRGQLLRAPTWSSFHGLAPYIEKETCRAGWMKAAFPHFVFVLLGVSVNRARAVRKSLDVKINHTWRAVGRAGLQSDTKAATHDTQVLASEIDSTLERESLEKLHVDGSIDNLVTATWNHSVFLEQSLVFMHKAKALPPTVTLILSLSIILTICCLTVLVAFVRRKKIDDEEDSDGEAWADSDGDASSKKEEEHEVKVEDLVRRLAMTVRKLPMGKISFLAGSHIGLGWKERHIGIWWGTQSHTWASTRLGWWESKQDHFNRSQPLNSIYLKDVSEVRLTDDQDNYPDPGVCIVHQGQGGQADNLFLFFSTDESAVQFVKDITMMIKKVKKADEAERSSISPDKAEC
jgi:hypothetical protein